MPPADNPVLETDRLILRKPRVSDLPRVQVLLDNWEIAKWLGALPSPYPDGAAAEWFERVSSGQARGEKCIFAIVIKDQPTDGIIGNVGLHRHQDNCWGMGFWLGQNYWRRGIMGEATKAVVRFAFESIMVERLDAFHFVGNEGSARILHHCGFVPTGKTQQWCEARGKEMDGFTMSLSRADFRA